MMRLNPRFFAGVKKCFKTLVFETFYHEHSVKQRYTTCKVHRGDIFSGKPLGYAPRANPTDYSFPASL